MTTNTVVNYPTNEIGSISQGVLGLTARQAKAMSDNGWQNLVDLKAIQRMTLPLGWIPLRAWRLTEVGVLSH